MTVTMCHLSATQNVVLRTAASASSESLLQISILGPHLKSSEGGFQNLCFTKLSKQLLRVLKFEKHTVSLDCLNMEFMGKSEDKCFAKMFLWQMRPSKYVHQKEGKKSINLEHHNENYVFQVKNFLVFDTFHSLIINVNLFIPLFVLTSYDVTDEDTDEMWTICQW